MGIKANYNKADIQRAFEQELNEIDELVFTFLSTVGEECVNLARLQGSYKDQTGNLRASVGYLVAKNGEPMKSEGFDPNAATATENDKDGVTGAKTGKEFAMELLETSNAKYVLVVVAGMNYAVYVERKQYDVITFTEANARIKSKELFDGLLK